MRNRNKTVSALAVMLMLAGSCLVCFAGENADIFEALEKGGYRTAYTYAKYTATNENSYKDVSVGLQTCSWLTRFNSNGSLRYDNRMYPVSEVKKWTQEERDKLGFSAEFIAEAETEGIKYLTKNFDGPFIYVKDKADAKGVTRDAWYSSKVYRPRTITDENTGQVISYGQTVGNNVYFGLTNDTITAKDKELVFLIEYLDSDSNRLTINYVNNGGEAECSSKAVVKGYTEEWNTVAVGVDNARFSNTLTDTPLATHAEDFRIRCHGEELYISRIMIIPKSEYDRAKNEIRNLPEPNNLEVTRVGNEIIDCPSQEIYDSKSNRTYYYMNVNGNPTIKPYVTSQCWNSDGTKFIVGDSVEKKMYEYDITTQKLRFLDGVDGSSAMAAVVTPKDIIYYTYGGMLFKINWRTYTRELVYSFGEEVSSISTLQVTNDGKYITGYYSGKYKNEKTANIIRLNLETGEVDGKLYKEFDADDPKYAYADGTSASMGVGHPIINPEYPDYMFFCHEGTTQNIPDRLWLGRYSTGEMYNMFLQMERSDGKSGECSGHEVWSLDGEHLYFVKYSVAQNTVGKKGIVRIDKDGDKGLSLSDITTSNYSKSSREYLGDEFDYWHCYPSGDDKWVVGDTNKGEVAILNTETGEEQLLAQFKMVDHNHPYQPHPQISYNGRGVNWQMANPECTGFDDSVVGIGWMDVSEITGRGIHKYILEDYENDLIKYVDEVFDKQGIPVIVTPIPQLCKNFEKYLDVASKVAREKAVPLVDLSQAGILDTHIYQNALNKPGQAKVYKAIAEVLKNSKYTRRIKEVIE